MGPEASFVTAEADDDRAAACARLFSGSANVRVLHGDWHEVLPPEAPFDLLFFDGGGWKRSPAAQMRAESERALELVAPGGVVAMDNLTPGHLWPADGPKWPEALREFWLGSDTLVASEVLTTPDSSAIVAVKR